MSWGVGNNGGVDSISLKECDLGSKTTFLAIGVRDINLFLLYNLLYLIFHSIGYCMSD